MKSILFLVMMLRFATPVQTWLTDFEKAKTEAVKDKKLILLNFSGSDWCGPCMRLKKEIFNSDAFNTFASENLLLVNADFPRLKKNKLSDQQTKQNENLASIYNANGSFPLTLLLNAEGKILKEWNGFPDVPPNEFVKQVKKVADANH
jgi:thioredoxin-related protein